jgi:hypothetical protein
MKLYKNWSKAELQRQDRAHAEIQLCHSYRMLAKRITEETGHPTSAQTLRRHLTERTMDPRLAVVISKLTGVSPFDLVPWLRPLMDELEEMAA